MLAYIKDELEVERRQIGVYVYNFEVLNAIIFLCEEIITSSESRRKLYFKGDFIEHVFKSVKKITFEICVKRLTIK